MPGKYFRSLVLNHQQLLGQIIWGAVRPAPRFGYVNCHFLLSVLKLNKFDFANNFNSTVITDSALAEEGRIFSWEVEKDSVSCMRNDRQRHLTEKSKWTVTAPSLIFGNLDMEFPCLKALIVGDI